MAVNPLCESTSLAHPLAAYLTIHVIHSGVLVCPLFLFCEMTAAFCRLMLVLFILSYVVYC